jgi:hypothetical protein
MITGFISKYTEQELALVATLGQLKTGLTWSIMRLPGVIR